jgi:tRNA dimethylallyltransferase
LSRFLGVVGPTGSGKSALAMQLAARLGGEIIGCDSVQLYRGFDVGAAKPTAAERAQVPHHLVDVLAWDEECDAARYAALARAAIADVGARGRVPIVCGGTGLYLRSLVGQAFHEDLPRDDALRARLAQLPLAEAYAELARRDPRRAAEVHANDRFRVLRALELVTLLGKPLSEALPPVAAGAPGGAPRGVVVLLTPDRAALHAAIARRTAAMLAGGLVDEVRGLLAAGVSPEAKPMRSIGYKETAAMLAGALPEALLEERIVAATRQYAKRQTTWFRKAPIDLALAAPDVDAVVRAWSGLVSPGA